MLCLCVCVCVCVCMYVYVYVVLCCVVWSDALLPSSVSCVCVGFLRCCSVAFRALAPSLDLLGVLRTN